MRRWFVFLIGSLLVACGGATESGAAGAVAATSAGASVTAGGRVILSSITGANPGGHASATIAGPPDTRCTITYTMPGGAVGNAAGLDPKTTDARGRATWTWYIATTTARGIGMVTVNCGGLMGSERILIGVGE